MPGSGPRRSLSVPRRFGVVLAFILAGAAACTTPPGADDGPPAGPGGTIPSSLRIALTSSGSLDPAELDTPESQLIADQIFDGLVGYDPGTGAVVPAVAETWDVRDGGRRFVFRLRGDATFHDGSPVTADRFVFAWNRLADPGRAAPFAFLLESIAGYRAFHAELEAPSLTGVRAANPRTLEVQLTRPWPDFIAVLGHPALSPLPASAEDAGFALQPVGNGPYRVATQAVPGSPVTLERHDAYHGPPAVVPNVVFAFHGT
ncbi:MAG TPA: ABC transporter substrate-binding protein, partial [Actinomycetota bacterium]|nr:ABC transporter substrate-binding protein [Actinomycetota bacterium]